MFCIVRVRSLLLVSCLVLTSQADGQPKGKKMDENRATVAVEMRSIEFSVDLPKKSVAGNSLDMIVQLKNQSKEEIGFYNSTFRSLRLKVIDAKGVPVPLTRYGQRTLGDSDASAEAGRRTKFVAPGKSISETVNLARLFDLSVPGEYKVSLKRIVNEDSPIRPVLNLELQDLKFAVIEPQK